MSANQLLRALLIASLLTASLGMSRGTDSTYARFNTILGNVDVQLYSDEAPNTVANFLTYVNSGAYYSSIIHRSVPASAGQGFAIFQGGTYNIRSLSFNEIPQNAAITNEFSISNTRGTIAMGLVGSDINSATSGWFFNTADNSGMFDPTKYTVFGQVANASSLAVMDALQAIPVPGPLFNAPFNQLPLINYVPANGVQLDNLVYVNSITRESAPANASITLGDLSPTASGSAQGVSFTTNPPGLNALVTYNGSLTAPTAAGSYPVAAYITSPGYTGSTTGTLVIGAAVAKTKATVKLTLAAVNYDGNPHGATVTTVPAGLAVTVTYNGQSAIPTIGGSYAVVATIDDLTYSGTAKGTLVIKKIIAPVAISNTTVTYNGNAQTATPTTTPPGLQVNLTYNGSATAPTNAGTYNVAGTISDPSYQGSATGKLVISKASATVTLGSLTAYYNGLPKPATATTTPSGLAVTFTYNGKSAVPVAPGSYAVVGTISNTNYTGSASGTLTISAAPASALLGASDTELTEGVNADGIATSVYFEYGLTASYGSQTVSQAIGSGKVPVNIYAVLSGLTPNTLYHFRLDTVTTAGTVYGPDETFTTLGFDTNEVTQKTFVAPGTSGAMFSSFGNPIVNSSNDVAFVGTLNIATGITAANDVGIWADDNTNTLQKIAQIGDAAPGTANATFLTLGDPLYNNSEAVAFRGTLKVATGEATASTATGIWSTSSGTLSLVARQGSVAPGTGGGTFSAFSSLCLPDSGGVLFLATLNSSKTPLINATNDVGIWQGNSAGDLHLVLQLGSTIGTAPNTKTITKLSFLPLDTVVNGQTRGFSTTANSFICNATFSNKTTGLVEVVAGTPQIIAESGGSVISGEGFTYASFGSPAINNNNHVAYLATLGSGGGITSSDNLLMCADDSTGTLQFLGESGYAAPGTNANFLTFSDPVFNNHDFAAFRATLKVAAGEATATTASGIWTNTSGSLALVIQQGSQAPGCPIGATFDAFNELALPDQGGSNNMGGVVFLATLNTSAPVGVTSSNNLGIWGVDNAGNLQLIARTGDTLDVNGTTKTVSGLSFLPSELYVNGQSRSVDQSTGNLVYLVTFTDKSTAIFNVVFP